MAKVDAAEAGNDTNEGILKTKGEESSEADDDVPVSTTEKLWQMWTQRRWGMILYKD